MKKYTLIGVDVQSGGDSSMEVRAPSVPDAASFGTARGLDVSRIEADDGGVFLRHGEGFCREVDATRLQHTASPARLTGTSDVGLILVSVLVPLVGFIAGAIRLAQRDRSGVKVIIAAIMGVALWSLVVAMIESNITGH